MDDAAAVGVGDGLAGVPERAEQGEPLLQIAAVAELVRERLAVDQAHRVVEPAVGAPARLVDRDDVRVLEPGRDARLEQEAALGLSRGRIGVLDHLLERDPAPEVLVEDVEHARLATAPLDVDLLVAARLLGADLDGKREAERQRIHRARCLDRGVARQRGRGLLAGARRVRLGCRERLVARRAGPLGSGRPGRFVQLRGVARMARQSSSGERCRLSHGWGARQGFGRREQARSRPSARPERAREGPAGSERSRGGGRRPSLLSNRPRLSRVPRRAHGHAPLTQPATESRGVRATTGLSVLAVQPPSIGASSRPGAGASRPSPSAS